MKRWRMIGIAAVCLLVAVLAPSQEARIYRSIAVMDFRYSGMTREQMQSVVDRLSLKILGTQGFRRVISREQRQQLLQEADGVGRRGSYERNQLQNADLIEAELAVLGEMRTAAGQLSVHLQLLEVTSGETLYNDRLIYASVDELLRDAKRLAAELVRASRQPRQELKEDPAEEHRSRELNAVAGFRVGQEGMTAAPGINGGSYLYAEVLAEFNRVTGISVKYSVGLFPAYSHNHLITVLPRVNIPLGAELYTAISAGYLLSTDYRSQSHHYLGARICPVHSGNLGGISIELLPLSLFFDMASRQRLFMIELLSIAFWLPYK